MHYRRLFLSLLLCVAIFFGAFLDSVSALDINGNTVKTYWNVNGLDVEFTDTITSSAIDDSLVIIVDVTPSEIITEGSVFDFSLSFNNSYATSMTVALEFIDVEGQSLGYSDTVSVEGQTILYENLIADADLSKIRVLFGISEPEWEEIIEDPGSSNIIGPGTYVGNDVLTSVPYTITGDSSKTITFTFKSNNVEYSKFRFHHYTNEGGWYLLRYVDSSNSAVNAFSYYSNLWVNQALRTLVVSEAQTFDEIFVNWFNANYKKQSVDSTEYTYDFSVTDFSYTNYGDSLLDRIWASIRQLPQYIANKIQGLFVPSEADIIQIKGKFEALLEDRFGVAYEAHDIIEDFAAAFSFDGEETKISFPEVTVNLAGTDFSFGGWEVDVIPDGMEVLQDALKLIGNMVATLLFIMAMRKRYEEVVH